MAIGASHAIREAGLRVPDDISVIGIDNHELSEYFDLSTMAQPAPSSAASVPGCSSTPCTPTPGREPVETIVPTAADRPGYDGAAGLTHRRATC